VTFAVCGKPQTIAQRRLNMYTDEKWTRN
jgi:hypothetical protein